MHATTVRDLLTATADHLDTLRPTTPVQEFTVHGALATAARLLHHQPEAQADLHTAEADHARAERLLIVAEHRGHGADEAREEADLALNHRYAAAAVLALVNQTVANDVQAALRVLDTPEEGANPAQVAAALRDAAERLARDATGLLNHIPVQRPAA
ncbi:hypothetical protein RM572_00580 [Streptomyces sp. DSM 42041]|uniref:Uncharacterized protein n=1 Tax=Streptomyces hazeniae TaxID=3075538 RepID=A0ABU2NKY6_9ACTN|nr:hypothetical protein [Streptomyces sp. DSM 42041]MDT0377271.1 hypothetical protein [Streptomyces sp. DSM 42041]